MANTGQTIRLNPLDVPNDTLMSKLLRSFGRAVVELDPEIPRLPPVKLTEDHINKRFWNNKSVRGLPVGLIGFVRLSAIHVDRNYQMWIDMDAERDDKDEYLPPDRDNYSFNRVQNVQILNTEKGIVIRAISMKFDVDLEFDNTKEYDRYQPVIRIVSALLFDQYTEDVAAGRK